VDGKKEDYADENRQNPGRTGVLSGNIAMTISRLTPTIFVCPGQLVLDTFQTGVSFLFLLGRGLVVLPNLGGAGDRNILADYAHVNEAVDIRQIIRRPERTRF
jgi:hypothetical protein